MRFHSLVILCFIILLVSACNGQPALPTAFHTQFPATASPLPTNAPRPTNRPRPTPTATDTPVATEGAPNYPQTQVAAERDATATMQTLVAALPGTATVIAQLNQATHPAIAIQEAWAAVRSVLPSDISVYMPNYMPARFRSPEVYEVVASDQAFGPHYTIGYSATTNKEDADTVVFILNIGAGGWGNAWAGPRITSKSITIDGVSGEFWMVPEQHPGPSKKPAIFYWAHWKKQEVYYEVKAISSQITEAEFMQIVHSLVQLKK